MPSLCLRNGVCALALLSAISSAQGQVLAANTTPETVIVTGAHSETDLPNKIITVDADQARSEINTVNSEDMLKYAPSILVRKRHAGDTQDPIATRTSGVGASARNLIYVDGILISAPIGNNNSGASPHFGIAAPQDVEALQVIYGPFAAEYGGGSIGAVINIATKMPDTFEAYADALGTVQDFRQYASDQTIGSSQLSAGIGDRIGRFAWRLSANHLETTSQPLAYVTAPRPAAASTAGVLATGAFDGQNRVGAAIAIVGAGGIEAQSADTDTLKLTYDFSGIQAGYTASLFHQSNRATAQSYLRDGAGSPVYSGTVNLGGFAYALPASAFSNNVYDWSQTHLAQGFSLTSQASEDFAWAILISDYAYLSDNQRVPTTALPGAFTTGAGTINRLTGTGWYTLDAKAAWQGWAGHSLSFGIHRDAEMFAQSKFNTADWTAGTPSSLNTQAKGRTTSDAIWIQDIWSLGQNLQATLGGRAESWRAYGGSNFSAAPALNVVQPKLSARAFSPKAALAYRPGDSWSFTAAWGEAARMPTVTELYQAITTGTVLTVPNPNLKPEHASSREVAAEWRDSAKRLRLSLFDESVGNALLAQSAPLLAGSSQLFSYVQNVGRTRARGIEVVGEAHDLFPGFDLSGSLTFVDARILRDSAFPAAIDKHLPQVPKFRASAVASWHATSDLTVTLAGRYSDRSFATIDNSDPIADAFQGFARYLVVDARVHYNLGTHWALSAGVDNFGNETYFLFHPFPQRSFVMEVRYAT